MQNCTDVVAHESPASLIKFFPLDLSCLSIIIEFIQQRFPRQSHPPYELREVDSVKYDKNSKGSHLSIHLEEFLQTVSRFLIFFFFQSKNFLISSKLCHSFCAIFLANYPNLYFMI